MSYMREFEIFSTNINSAARSFHYHKEIQSQVYDDAIASAKKDNSSFQGSKLFQAMEANAGFWNDYKYSSIQYSIIILGRIFDKSNSSHSIKRLIKLAKNTKDFKKENLRKRKIAESDNYQEWIDDYIKDAHELDQSDLSVIEKHISETQNLWEDIKSLRNKLYAHQDRLSDDEKSEIFKNTGYSKIESIIQRLLTLRHIFWQTFHNGSTPDFNYKDADTKEWAIKEISSLLARLA